MDDYFPAAAGLRWTYSVSGDPDRGYHSAPLGSFELVIRGPAEGSLGAEVGSSGEAQAWQLAGGWFGADALLVSEHGARIYTRTSEEGGRLGSPALIADLRWDGPDSWESGAAAGRYGSLRGERLGTERVSVPSGTFECTRIAQTGVGWRSTLWLARGVGIVKHEVHRRWGERETMQTWVLTSGPVHPAEGS